MKCRLKAGNSCYYSVQTLLSSRLFGLKRDEEWRRLHIEELQSLYRLTNILIESRRLRWAGHVARMEEGVLSKF